MREQEDLGDGDPTFPEHFPWAGTGINPQAQHTSWLHHKQTPQRRSVTCPASQASKETEAGLGLTTSWLHGWKKDPGKAFLG